MLPATHWNVHWLYTMRHLFVWKTSKQTTFIVCTDVTASGMSLVPRDVAVTYIPTSNQQPQPYPTTRVVATLPTQPSRGSHLSLQSFHEMWHFADGKHQTYNMVVWPFRKNLRRTEKFLQLANRTLHSSDRHIDCNRRRTIFMWTLSALRSSCWISA